MPEPPIEIITPSAQDAEAIATVLYRASAAASTGIVPPGFLWTLEQTVTSCERLLNDPAATLAISEGMHDHDGVVEVRYQLALRT